MKQFSLMRHAKSSWAHPELDDFDRGLNSRGRRDAPAMGERLFERGILPDLIASSPAKRAATTARAVAEAIGYPVSDIRYVDRLYMASSVEIIELVRSMPDEFGHVMVFGHNPGMMSLANRLLDEPLPNLPTSGFVSVAIAIDAWAKFPDGRLEVIHVDYPKKPRQESARTQRPLTR